MTGIHTRALDRELKRGSAELLILSLLDARPRHGYELSKLIHTRSGGELRFHIDSLYPLLYRLEERGWIKGAWVEKSDERRRRFYKVTAEGRRVLAQQRKTWEAFVEAVRASRETNMPDWTQHVRPRLSPLRLSPAREAEIVEELSQHLDDRWRELVAGGASPDEATRLALADFRDGDVLAQYIWRRCGRRILRHRSRRVPPAANCSAISGRTCGTPRACCGSGPALLSPPF